MRGEETSTETVDLEVLHSGREHTRQATRYLCVGAHLDPVFRTRLLRHILDKRHRAIAPSYGIDVVPVLRHALDAQRRLVARDVLILAILVVALFISFWQFLSLLLLVQSGRLLLAAIRSLDGNLPGAARKAILAVLLLWLSLMTGLTALSSAIGGTDYGSGSTSLQASLGASTARVLLSVALALLGTFGCLLSHRLIVHELILNELTSEGFDPERAPTEPSDQRDRIAYVQAAQSGNVTMYARSRESNPFVGSGQVQSGSSWSIALPLVPNADANDDADDDPDPPARSFTGPLTVSALYRAMRRALVSLSDPSRPPAERILGLSLQDRLFAVGLLPPRHELLDQGVEPVFRITRQQMLRLAEQERNIATHFLTVRISGWNGELEVTIFLYFSIRGQMLYIEFLSAVLPPIKDAYHAVDSYERVGAKVAFQHGAGAILETPRALVDSPVRLLQPIAERVGGWLDLRSQLQDISNRVAYDYGAVGSVREFGAEWHRENMLHALDADRHIRVVERRVLDSIRDVLLEFGLRTEEFDQRSSSIIDNSIRIENSSFTNSAAAFGSGARASTDPSPSPSAGRR